MKPTCGLSSCVVVVGRRERAGTRVVGASPPPPPPPPPLSRKGMIWLSLAILLLMLGVVAAIGGELAARWFSTRARETGWACSCRQSSADETNAAPAAAVPSAFRRRDSDWLGKIYAIPGWAKLKIASEFVSHGVAASLVLAGLGCLAYYWFYVEKWSSPLAKVLIAAAALIPSLVILFSLGKSCSQALGELSAQKSQLRHTASKLEADVEARLADGSIRILSVTWLLQLDAKDGRIMRRQDLSEEAFIETQEAVRLYRRGLIYVFSYGWLTPDHCDPGGFCLKALHRFFRGYEEAHKYVPPAGPASTYAVRKEGHGFGLFWDFACLYQKPEKGKDRSKEEQEIFDSALQVMGNLYGSKWRTTVLQHKLVPHSPMDAPEHYNETPVDQRGWCQFEEAAALLAVGHRSPYDRTIYGNPPKLIDISGYYPYTIEPSEPPPIDHFVQRLENATFTGRGDKDTVVKMLKTFDRLLQQSLKDREIDAHTTLMARRGSRFRDRVRSVLMGHFVLRAFQTGPSVAYDKLYETPMHV